jgi:transaldolase
MTAMTRAISEVSSGPEGAAGLQIKIFADGADLSGMLEYADDPLIKGFTTNPTLMHQAGITDYEAFAREALAHITDRPISFEVFSDEFDEMHRQARKLAALGSNVVVKIPVTNTRCESTGCLIAELAAEGIPLNVTAVMTLDQIRSVADKLADGAPSIISVFAGRVADTGRDPVPLMRRALDITNACPNLELLWASPRELLNVVQADEIGCDIITVTHAVLKKLGGLGKDLDRVSLETVKMFAADASAAGFLL